VFGYATVAWLADIKTPAELYREIMYVSGVKGPSTVGAVQVAFRDV
jgi:hypothetical protein